MFCHVNGLVSNGCFVECTDVPKRKNQSEGQPGYDWMKKKFCGFFQTRVFFEKLIDQFLG